MVFPPSRFVLQVVSARPIILLKRKLLGLPIFPSLTNRTGPMGPDQSNGTDGTLWKLKKNGRVARRVRKPSRQRSANCTPQSNPRFNESDSQWSIPQWD